MTHKESGNLICGDGLLPKEVIKRVLRNYPIECIFAIRSRLSEACPGLREKLNRNSRYLGYGRIDASDRLYIYVRKKELLIDIRLPANRAAKLRASGFKVCHRDNFQGKAGWLTGVLVPHDTDKLQMIVALALEALN